MIAMNNYPVRKNKVRYFDILQDRCADTAATVTGETTGTEVDFVRSDANVLSYLMDEIRAEMPLFAIPAHRARNPFEQDIHVSIRAGHKSGMPNRNRNTTFQRVNFKGFI